MKGSNNAVADALSRVGANILSADGSPPMIDFKAMAEAQALDKELQNPQLHSSLKLERTPLAVSNTTILCDVSTGVARPYMPPDFRHAVFDSLH